jgi:hypothetical protein
MRILHVLILVCLLSGAVAQQAAIPKWVTQWKEVCYYSVVGAVMDLEGKTFDQVIAQADIQPRVEYTSDRVWSTTTRARIPITSTDRAITQAFFGRLYQLYPALKKFTFAPPKVQLVSSSALKIQGTQAQQVALLTDIGYMQFDILRLESLIYGGTQTKRDVTFGCRVFNR